MKIYGYTFLGLVALAVVAAAVILMQPARIEQPRTIVDLGRDVFNDPAYSASGVMSCATCHDPNHAFGPVVDMIQMGGPNMDLQGMRTVPSLQYARYTPAFHFDEEGTPVGGLTHDGRADTFAQQAVTPLMDAREMANTSSATIVASLRKAPYYHDFERRFGKEVMEDDAKAFDALVASLQAFQTEGKEFAPFNSRFDRHWRGEKNVLTAQELRGLELFKNPKKGNCAACHVMDAGPKGEPPLFTDYTFDVLGIPRNRALAHNADPAFYDLGLCGPHRKDLAEKQPELCGAFKVPSLRNVALRKAFFHNASATDLAEAVRFYVQRATHPEKWFKHDRVFDDLPQQFVKNVNHDEAPYDRKKGQQPRLNEQEIQDVVAFLKTLTDEPLPSVNH